MGPYTHCPVWTHIDAIISGTVGHFEFVGIVSTSENSESLKSQKLKVKRRFSNRLFEYDSVDNWNTKVYDCQLLLESSISGETVATRF